MKKITLAIASIFALSGSITAQEFAPVGTTWYYSTVTVDWEWVDGNPIPYYPTTGFKKFEVTEELEIGGKTCKKIPHGNIYFYEEDNKIYRYNSYLESWYLLVDFNLEIDDTYILPLSETTYDNQNEMTLTVNSKETVIIEGEERIKISVSGKYLDPNYSQEDHDAYARASGTFISGIGRIDRNPLALYFTHDEMDQAYPNEDTLEYPIRCYSDGNVNYTNPHDYYNDFYFDGSDCEAKNLDVVDFSSKEASFSAFPNPVKNLISINTTENFDYEIFDTNGKSVLKGNASPQEQINLEKIEKGIYFMTIITSRKSGTMKIVKE